MDDMHSGKIIIMIQAGSNACRQYVDTIVKRVVT